MLKGLFSREPIDRAIARHNLKALVLVYSGRLLGLAVLLGWWLGVPFLVNRFWGLVGMATLGGLIWFAFPIVAGVAYGYATHAKEREDLWRLWCAHQNYDLMPGWFDKDWAREHGYYIA